MALVLTHYNVHVRDEAKHVYIIEAFNALAEQSEIDYEKRFKCK